jgi:hypothetical protein
MERRVTERTQVMIPVYNDTKAYFRDVKRRLQMTDGKDYSDDQAITRLLEIAERVLPLSAEVSHVTN